MAHDFVLYRIRQHRAPQLGLILTLVAWCGTTYMLRRYNDNMPNEKNAEWKNAERKNAENRNTKRKYIENIDISKVRLG
jgi:hypothetical protein